MVTLSLASLVYLNTSASVFRAPDVGTVVADGTKIVAGVVPVKALSPMLLTPGSMTTVVSASTSPAHGAGFSVVKSLMVPSPLPLLMVSVFVVVSYW